MALDEALSGTVRAGGPPFLRFYSWEPPTLSLGRFQNSLTGLTPGALSVPRVRRLTGGGAIWHSQELTYSLACTQDDLGALSVKASFEKLCGFLLDTWISLGWDACFAKDLGPGDGSLGRPTPACFAGKEEYDILVTGKKLGGNAQRRDKKVVFQHGSIPLLLDHDRLEALFAPGFRPDRKATTDLTTLGWPATQALTPALVRSFEARMEVSLVPSEPTDDEGSQAEQLVKDRYGQPLWTETGAGAVREP